MRSLLVVALLASSAQAQIFDVGVRYELGQRLRMFEAALDRHKDDKKAIARAIPPVAAATPAFFAGRLGEAASILDRARLTLADEKPEHARLWASAWRFVLPRRVAAARDGEVSARLERLYPWKSKYAFDSGMAGFDLGPHHGTVAWWGEEKGWGKPSIKWRAHKEGDFPLSMSISGEKGQVLFESSATLSVIDDLDARLKKLETSDALGKKTVESATLAHHLGILKTLAKGDPLETDYPAHRLLVEAEAIAAGKWDNKKPGQYWLALPGVGGSPVRVSVPKEAAKGKPLPVVVAMHGAGGSENMFFDGYGNGLVAKLASERGWFVVTTRSPVLAFGGGPDVPAVLDALAKIHPLDLKKVCIIGHSMGAAQTVQAAAKHPERFIAAAALGGGGTFKASDALKKVPFHVAVGEKDFLLKNARSLDGALRKAGVTSTLKEHENVEHLTIVQLALPEVFAFFDKAVRGK